MAAAARVKCFLLTPARKEESKSNRERDREVWLTRVRIAMRSYVVTYRFVHHSNKGYGRWHYCCCTGRSPWSGPPVTYLKRTLNDVCLSRRRHFRDHITRYNIPSVLDFRVTFLHFLSSWLLCNECNKFRSWLLIRAANQLTNKIDPQEWMTQVLTIINIYCGGTISWFTAYDWTWITKCNKIACKFHNKIFINIWLYINGC